MERISNLFDSSVFNEQVMRERLPKDVYNKIQRTIKEGSALEPNVADVVANSMKDWAIDKGATHFTHWFQPMTGRTAEKHEALFTITKDGMILEEFSGKNLIMGEGDASSFPSGGLRATFEARGYTAWDCTSPAFLKEKDGAVTLCIPTAFYSYTGEALDKKTPLLRSMQALEIAAKRVLKFFDCEPNRVYTTMGAEQEYFLIDKRLYQKRKDIIYTGRTLFGAPTPKEQDLKDHYYGTIKEHIFKFMKDIDEELWKLGIPVKTKHNEVAPGQYELAPIFSTVNIAADQNQIILETLETIANRHNLVCLLHEKPFKNINGSGKHNNWSLATDDGTNLLEPGNTPLKNTQFLMVLSAIIKAVDEHAEILRLSAATYTNDFRLGANEAPPAIISIFVGDQLEEVLYNIENNETNEITSNKKINTGVITLPDLHKDVTDRNRTSPFAFTGNKFEFRMVGSEQTIADPNIIINTIIADVLNEFADELEKSDNVTKTLKQIIRTTIKNHKRIIFNGNGYANEWIEEAEKRKLPNLPSLVDAIPYYISEKTINMFKRNKIFQENEIFSRYEIKLEDYVMRARIEATTMIHIANKEIIPAVIKYSNDLANSINTIKQTNLIVSTKMQGSRLQKIGDLLDQVYLSLENLMKAKDKAESIENYYERAKVYREEVLKDMEALREPCDELELLVGTEYWPFPTYGDLLFRI